MTHRSFLWIVFVIFVAAFSANAQITISAGNILGPGNTLDNREADGVTLSTGSAGPNQTWTIPDYTWTTTESIEIVDPANTPFAADFPTATRAQRMVMGGESGTEYVFERIVNDGYYVLGNGQDFEVDSLDTAYPYVNSAMFAPLPLTYGASWTMVARWSMEMFGMTVSFTDSTLETVDGWGTLNTPLGSAQTLRIRAHSFLTMEITGIPPQTSEFIGYSWIDSRGVGVAMMSTDGNDPNFTFGDVSLTGWNSVPADEPRGPVAESFRVGQNYPNPFNPSTTLPVELSSSSQVMVDIYDGTGRLVSSESFDLTPGRHDLPVNGSKWATGTYFARVSAAGQQQTAKMMLVK